MQTLADLVLSNAIIATGLAMVAALIGRNCRRPQVVYVLWLLVLVKLVTPPLVRWPVEFEVAQGGFIASVLEQSESEGANSVHEALQPVAVPATLAA